MKTNTQNTNEIPFPQEPLWQETLRLIAEVDSAELLTKAKAIENLLHFNSKESRGRYSRAIATRFKRLDHQDAYSGDSGQRIRRKPATHSSRFRPLIPEEGGHEFQLKPAARSDGKRPIFSERSDALVGGL